MSPRPQLRAMLGRKGWNLYPRFMTQERSMAFGTDLPRFERFPHG